MTTKRLLLIALFAGVTGLAGCGPPGTVKEEKIAVKEQKASAQAVDLLNRYAKGQPLGSEVTTFPQVVAGVREEDPFRADILEKGFAELKTAPKGTLAAKAKEILAKLAPQQRPPG
jgi:hypothetical protein